MNILDIAKLIIKQVGELYSLNCGDIEFLEDGWVRVHIRGTKNKDSRRMKHIRWTVPYLLEWKLEHPNWKNESPLFRNKFCKKNRGEFSGTAAKSDSN